MVEVKSSQEVEHRYELSESVDEIREHVNYIFENNPVSKKVDVDKREWEVEWVDIEDIDADTEDHKEESNVALHERRLAVEKAQLTVGEGHPLVVEGEDNVLIEGYARYSVLKEHFEEDEVPVYRAN